MQTKLTCENIRFSSLFAAGDVSSVRNVPSGEDDSDDVSYRLTLQNVLSN